VSFCERLLSVTNAGFAASSSPFTKVFFAENGSTAVEVALKMALHAQALWGHPQRTRFAALSAAITARLSAHLSVGDLGLYADPYRPLLFPSLQLAPTVAQRPRRSALARRECRVASDRTTLQTQANELAAIIYEPILQGAGGMRVVSPDLLTRLRAWADAHDVLLIADEIAAGMGRCGTMLASHLATNARPDIAVVGKGLTSGTLPLACTLTTQRISTRFWGHGPKDAHFSTQTRSPAMRSRSQAASAVLAVFERDRICEQATENGEADAQVARDFARTRPWISNVRVSG